MALYSKSLCPKCKTILKGWHQSYITFGNPFIVCPKCRVTVRSSEINEWEAMSLLQRIEYISIFYFQSLMWGGGSIAILGIIYEEIFHSNSLVINDKPTILFLWVIGLGATVSLAWVHTKFQSAVTESRFRTKDGNYRKMLGI